MGSRPPQFLEEYHTKKRRSVAYFRVRSGEVWMPACGPKRLSSALGADGFIRLLMTQSVIWPASIAALRKDHSITSSAMESTPGGTSMPSTRAVCRLMKNSNLVDCSTDGLCAPEDAAGIDAVLTETVREVGSVAHQPAGRDKVTLRRTAKMRFVTRSDRLRRTIAATQHTRRTATPTYICWISDSITLSLVASSVVGGTAWPNSYGTTGPFHMRKCRDRPLNSAHFIIVMTNRSAF
jgi:hypothetical protein